jgi:hypothetical protein
LVSPGTVQLFLSKQISKVPGQNKSSKFVCPGTLLKKRQLPGHKQIVLICPGIMLKLRIIPGQDNLNKICDIFKVHNNMLIF